MHAAHALLTLACYFDSRSQRASRPVATSSDTTSWIEKPARVVAWSWLTLQLTRIFGYVTLSRKNRKKWITFPFCTNLKCKLQTCQMKKWGKRIDNGNFVLTRSFVPNIKNMQKSHCIFYRSSVNVVTSQSSCPQWLQYRFYFSENNKTGNSGLLQQCAIRLVWDGVTNGVGW